MTMRVGWDSRTDEEIYEDWLRGDGSWDPYREDERSGIRATIPQAAWAKPQRTGWDVVADWLNRTARSTRGQLRDERARHERGDGARDLNLRLACRDTGAARPEWMDDPAKLPRRPPGVQR